MGEILELVFEKLTTARAWAVMSDVIARADHRTPVLSEGCVALSGSALRAMSNMGGAVTLTLDAFPISSYGRIEGMSLRLLRAGGQFDLELSLSLAEADDLHRVVDAFYGFAAEVSARYGGLHYYCGLEPAVDLDTRFFTDRRRGPLGR